MSGEVVMLIILAMTLIGTALILIAFFVELFLHIDMETLFNVGVTLDLVSAFLVAVWIFWWACTRIL